MLKFIVRRLIQAIPTFFGITMLAYAIMALSPGGPDGLFLVLTDREAIQRQAVRLKLRRRAPVIVMRWWDALPRLPRTLRNRLVFNRYTGVNFLPGREGLPPRGSGQPAAWPRMPRTRPNDAVPRRSSGSIEWAASPAKSARAWPPEKVLRARKVADCTAWKATRASANGRGGGSGGGTGKGASSSGAISSHASTYGVIKRL